MDIILYNTCKLYCVSVDRKFEAVPGVVPAGHHDGMFSSDRSIPAESSLCDMRERLAELDPIQLIHRPRACLLTSWMRTIESREIVPGIQ